jgi:uncharacterized membrane-anchored protein
MRIRGTARVDRRTKNLIHRIAPGEIAVISHTDLDAPCASALAEKRVAAVVNAQRSLSGRFPHAGPGIILGAGIPLLDDTGDYVMEQVHEGQALEIVDGAVHCDGTLIATGELLTEALLQRRLEEAKGNLTAELARFVENTMSYVSQEQALLFEPSSLPKLPVRIKGRHCLVVVRGTGASQDLRAIRSYIAAMRPVTIGVDGGADLLLQEGYRPDIIIGDMDSVSDAALRRGAALIVHAYPDGAAPGLERVQAMGLDASVLPFRGTSEDVAMMLVHENEAELIVAVGTHFSLTEFLEKARGGMSSSFLVRLRVGSVLMDAKGIGRLYPSGRSGRLFLYLGLVASVIILVLLTAAPDIRATLELWVLRLGAFFRSLRL